MKKLKFLLALAIFVIASNVGFSLPPYFYTNIAINTSGQLIPSTAINVEISILQNNTLVYKELHNGISTSAFSFFSVEVGTGILQDQFERENFTDLTANVTLKTQARIEISEGTWVSLGAAYNTNVINKGFTGNPAEIDLPSGMILVGDALNNASAVSIHNNATIDNTGALTISNNAITTSKITDGNVTYSKIQSASAPNKLLVSNGSNNWIETSASSAGLNLLNIADGNVNQSLISNGDGTVQWKDPLSSGWGLTGNSGTNPTNNFIGTTDGVELNFRVSNQKAGRIGTSDGNLFLGYQAGNSNSTLFGNRNTFLGFQSGFSNTDGFYNTANGYQALYSNTTTSYNTANGVYALYSNTSGSSNTANGVYALYSNTSGGSNTANGAVALYSNTTGIYNTANGVEALHSNTTGNYNTTDGDKALYYSSTGNNNVALGASAGYGADGVNFDNCTFVGAYSYPTQARANVTMLGSGITNTQCTGDNQVILGNSNVTGFYVGTGSLTTTTNPANMHYDSTTGQIMRSTAPIGGSGWGLTGNSGTDPTNNFIGTTDGVALNFRVSNQKAGHIGTSDGSVFLGYQAGANNDLSLRFNTFIGYQSGMNNTTGDFNTANGYKALYSNITGYNNAANGNDALLSNTAGSFNTANGSLSLSSNTIGNYNTANGTGALYSNVAGSSATAIGYQAMYYANNQATDFANHNVAVGFEALYGSTTPANNTGNYNTATGYMTLFSNTSGSYNTANGNGASYSNTTGNNNTAIGFNALTSNTAGISNVALGFNAGSGADNVDFNFCTFVGVGSSPIVARSNVTMIGYGISNTQCTGDNQVILGNSSVTGFSVGTGLLGTTANPPNLYYSSTNGKIMRSTYAPTGSGWGLTGNSGTFDGTHFIGTSDFVALNFRVNNQEAGRIGTLYDGSVFLGYQAGANDDLLSNFNTFIGYQAGTSTTTGNANTANGYKALFSNTSGFYNTANGYQALYSNTTTAYNTAVGYQALYSNTYYFNTATGYQALYSNTSGSSNTANGYQALYSTTTGIKNTASGTSALYSNTTGYNNTANGLSALYFNTTGSGNVAIGDSAGYGASTVNFTNCTFVGAHSYPTQARTNVAMLGYGITDAQCTGDNQVILGNGDVTGFYFGDGNLSTTGNTANMYYNSSTGQIMLSTSSARYKTDITDLEINTSKIYNLRPVSFTSKMPNDKNERLFGLIAEEVSAVIPELAEYAREKDVVPGSTSDRLIPNGVKYPILSVLMLKEVQKHENKIQEQQTTIEKLQNENQALKEQLNMQQEQMATMMQEIEKIKQEIAKKDAEPNNNQEFFGEKK